MILICRFTFPLRAALESVMDSDRPSKWWQTIRDILSKSDNLEQACSAALVCKSVTIEIEKKLQFQARECNLAKREKAAGDDEAADEDGDVDAVVKMDDSMSDWEDMSVDMVQWNVLLKQLEDLSYLSRLTRYTAVQLRRANCENLNYPVQISPADLNFTLATVLQKGRGDSSISTFCKTLDFKKHFQDFYDVLFLIIYFKKIIFKFDFDF